MADKAVIVAFVNGFPLPGSNPRPFQQQVEYLTGNFGVKCYEFASSEIPPDLECDMGCGHSHGADKLLEHFNRVKPAQMKAALCLDLVNKEIGRASCRERV